jgi:hypothetical protein
MVLHFKDNNDFDLVPECISFDPGEERLPQSFYPLIGIPVG